MLSSDKLLAELIALPSVNPAFLPEGDSRAGEKLAGDYLLALGGKAGLDADTQQVFPGRANIFLELSPARKPQQTVLLAPHLDTVGVVDMDERLFRPRKSQGRLYGRGACDTKGSVAAMFSALLKVAERGKRPQTTRIIFVGLVDEENGQNGSRLLAESGYKADLAIVGEPTELQVITSHKGDLWLKLLTRGKAAHGARPELGKNAILDMARVVQCLENDYARILSKRSHAVLGSPTINVGMIRGGNQPNIVPDLCEIQIDRRTIPGEDDRKVEREILGFIQSCGVQAELVNTKGAACLPLETSTELPLVRQFMKIAAQTKPAGVDFFSDAGVLAAGGIPSIVFGPGNIAQAHTPDEWISLDSLKRGTALLEKFLRSLP